MPSLSLWGYFLSTSYWVTHNRHQVCLVGDPDHLVCLLGSPSHTTCLTGAASHDTCLVSAPSHLLCAAGVIPAHEACNLPSSTPF